MIKNKIKLLLQKTLGFDNYLFFFSIISIRGILIKKHEREFVHFLSLLPEEHLLLDIGANIGIMTVPLAKKAVKGKVYAFEPIPHNIHALKRIIKFFKVTNVTIFEYALSNKADNLKMVMPIINNVKMEGLCHLTNNDNAGEGEQFTVPVKILDDVPELQKVNVISGIKIDVENFQYEVLTGAKNLILKHQPLIYCEIWGNEKRKMTIDYMEKEMGYTIKIFDGKKLVPYNNQNIINYFLIPNKLIF